MHRRGLLLRALAAVEGIEDRGTVSDRAGRNGTAFSAPRTAEDGTRRELVLVIGALGEALAVEEVRPGAAPVATAYQLLVEADHVPAAGQRPA